MSLVTVSPKFQVVIPTILLLEAARRVMQQRDEDAAVQIAAMLHRGNW